METRINASKLDIDGKTAHVVHADTADIVLLRDSLADESSGLFTVHTSLTLVLDSIYPTDQMEDSLALRLQTADGELLVTLMPTDSQIADSLVAYLQKGIGSMKEIAFEGLMDGESILKLQNGAKASFTGFSFLFADPEISKQIDDLRKGLNTLADICKEAQQASSRDMFSGFIYAAIIGEAVKQLDSIDKKLQKVKSQMTPHQLLRFEACHQELLSYDMRK